MQAIAKLYPPLALRPQIPTFIVPATFALTLLPFFTLNRRRTALFVLPIILSACVSAPHYTFGDPSSDFYRSSASIIMPLWFIEFAICRPQKGKDTPLYVGQPDHVKKRKEHGKGIEDCETVWEKICWAGELMVPSHRGIGWNWQIKNVPVDADADLPRWRWIANHVQRAIFSYLGSLCMLAIVGFITTLEKREVSSFSPVMIDAIIGWAVALWIYLRLCTFYSTSSALTVTLHIYEPWQLPPLMGPVQDAWSVRQFWAVYHQTMRQMVSQPALRLTRLLGLRKGTLASSLVQLYLAFGVSCLIHQYQMFNVTRRDMGEFAFFMGQPLAITLEGGIMWLWKRYMSTSHGCKQWVTSMGYAWVFLWFSFTLPVYLRGMRDAEIVLDAFLGTVPGEYGAALAKEMLER